jgi:hypothetical protein
MFGLASFRILAHYPTIYFNKNEKHENSYGGDNSNIMYEDRHLGTAGSNAWENSHRSRSDSHSGHGGPGSQSGYGGPRGGDSGGRSYPEERYWMDRRYSRGGGGSARGKGLKTGGGGDPGGQG